MILAVDLGSTSFKAGVFGPDMRCLGEGAAKVEYRLGPGGAVEFDATECERSFREAAAGALKTAAVDAASLAAIGIASQAQTFTVLGQGAKPLMPFVSWQDARAGSACRNMKGDPRMAGFGDHCSFGELIQALQVAQLRRIREEAGGPFPVGANVMHLPSFLAWRLTGVSVVDENLAAMSGLYSLPRREWWGPALEAVGLSVRQLSEVVPVGTAAATTKDSAGAFGMGPGVPVVLAGNDQTAGAYGAEIHSSGLPLIWLGTAQVVYAVVPAMPSPAKDRARGPYPGGLFYLMAADSCGGNVINWAKTVLPGCGTDAEFFALAAASPPDLQRIAQE